MDEGIEREIEEIREVYRCGRTKQESWRRAQLKGLQRFLKEREAEIFRALRQDLGKHHIEAFRDEVALLRKSLNFALQNLKGWMSSKKAKLPLVALGSSAEVLPEPLGLILVISTWNLPIDLSLEPLIGAVAAGNAAVLKTSELAPACASLLATSIPDYVDSKAIKVFQGGPDLCQTLLQQKWDKIFFTGSSKVGRIVMEAASRHLTPVVLELGGKCPAVLDTLSWSWDKETAASRIIGAKFGSCAGQACLSVDYILVEKSFAPTMVGLLKVQLKNMFGEDPKESRSISRIINKHHFQRLRNLVSEKKIRDSVVYGGSMDEDSLYIEPTILIDPPLSSELMTEEVFGPLLPIITLDKIEESVDFINARPKALAIYVFTKNESFKKRMVSETSSGSVVFNDAVIQFAVDTLPFGGVGESGMGKYHGKFSFDTFSHSKVIARRSFLTDFWFRFPPWNNLKMDLIEHGYNYDYFGMILVMLGLKRPRKGFEIV